MNFNNPRTVLAGSLTVGSTVMLNGEVRVVTSTLTTKASIVIDHEPESGLNDPSPNNGFVRRIVLRKADEIIQIDNYAARAEAAARFEYTRINGDTN